MDKRALIAVLAVLIPIIGGPLCFVIEKISKRLRTWYAVLLGFITGGLTLLLIPCINKGNIQTFLWIPGASSLTIGISLDSFNVFVAVVAGCIGGLVMLYSTRYMEEWEGKYSLSRYYWLALLFIGGMIGLALTSNFLVMYVFWEIIGFCSYALIAYYYKEKEPVPAGTKAFIVTRIGDIGFLTGILVLWHATGTLNVFEIIAAAKTGLIPANLLCIAGIGFILGAVGKSAQFPLHIWLPDAMTAPTTITSLIHAACLVNAGIYLLGRSYPIFMGLEWWSTTILWIGAITALMAATIALTEWDIKRVLAYSTISQLGYMTAAIGGGAVLASQFHLVSHGIFKALLFLCAGAIIHMAGTKDMRKMGGFRKEMKVIYICFIFGLLSLVGIPVWTGFFSKDMILANLMEEKVVGALIFLIIGVFFTAAYSWRMFWLVFNGNKRTSVHIHKTPWEMGLPLIILAGGSLLFWVYISRYTSSMVFSLSPEYPVSYITLEKLIHHSFSSPVIFVSIAAIILLIIFTFSWKTKVEKTFQKASALTLPLMKAYWVDIFYQKVLMKGVYAFWRKFRKIQTGDLNYNNAGIVFGFLLFLVLLLVVK